MLTAAIFFKGFETAKSRLQGVLSPRERAAFAWQMLLRVVDAAKGARGVGEVIIVTAGRGIEEAVSWRGVRTLREARPQGLNHAVRFAIEVLALEGKEKLLIVPADLPRIMPTHIESLLEAHARAGTDTIVPSSDGSGTNALIVDLPLRFEPAFGPDSFYRHIANAARNGHPFAIHRCAYIGVDIDQPGDLRHLPCGIMS